VAVLEEGLVTHLRADAGIQALVNNGDSPATYRIYAELLPQEVVYPAISYQRISSPHDLMMEGIDTFTPARIQIDCHAQTSAAASGLAAAVNAALNNVTGSLGGVTVQHSHNEQRSDLSSMDGDLVIRRITLDYVFLIHES
jgi:hypothetical protein